MNHLQTYKLFEDILSGVRSDDLDDILLELSDKGLNVDTDTPSMRQDWIQIIIESPNKYYKLSDVQETLCRLYDYTLDKDRRPSITAFGFQTGALKLNYHDSIREYRNPYIKNDTGINMIMITIPK